MAKKTTTTNDAGRILCPECGAEMTPMRGKMEGKGWNCSRANWRPGQGVTGCKGVLWAGSRFQKKKEIERPADWLTLKKRTPQQQQIRDDFASSPVARGGRLVIIDAGPGTGKSTTIADCAEALFRRVGSLIDDFLCAFNVNAKDSLLAKLPAHFANIVTINGFGGRLQGLQGRQYDKDKLRGIFQRETAAIPQEDRPRFSGVKDFVERLRDTLIYVPATDKVGWNQAIDAIASRFPALAKTMRRTAKTEETIREFVPLMMTLANNQRQTVDLNEQYSRPVTDVIRAARWKLPDHLAPSASAEWSDADIAHLGELVKSLRLRQIRGVIVDEAQDLSLCQIVLFVASTWRSGELTLVGDDARGKQGDNNYKAGQAIFGWRGAFNGSLTLIARLWKYLTGEDAIRRDLSVTFRLPPEGCDAIRPLHATLESSKPRGSGLVAMESADMAFQRWSELADGDTALWLTRTNRAAGPVFIQSIKAYLKVTLRGAGDVGGQFDALMYSHAGYYDSDWNYKISLRDALASLAAESAADEASPEASPDDFGALVLEIGQAILADPSLLSRAEIMDGRATVGNLRRFIVHFTDRNAPRVISTVYKAKGDEADLVIVDDTEQFNAAWNGDEAESAAVRLVACSRQRKTMILTGPVRGVIVPGLDDEEDSQNDDTADEVQAGPEVTSPAPIAPKVILKKKKK